MLEKQLQQKTYLGPILLQIVQKDMNMIIIEKRMKHFKDMICTIK
jgi:hypothetical protein